MLPNAIRIAHSLALENSEIDLTPALIEEVEAAANALAVREARDGFTWESARADWETVCTMIARRLTDGRPTNWVEFVGEIV